MLLNVVWEKTLAILHTRVEITKKSFELQAPLTFWVLYIFEASNQNLVMKREPSDKRFIDETVMCSFPANVQLSHQLHRQLCMELACQTLNVATMEAQLMEIVQAVLAFAVPTWFLPVLLQSPITGNVNYKMSRHDF